MIRVVGRKAVSWMLVFGLEMMGGSGSCGVSVGWVCHCHVRGGDGRQGCGVMRVRVIRDGRCARIGSFVVFLLLRVGRGPGPFAIRVNRVWHGQFSDFGELLYRFSLEGGMGQMKLYEV
jgi:hypothetical protein